MSEPKNHVHVRTTVGDQGSVTLDRLPYQPGQRVDVTISPVDLPPAARARYPLAGVKVEYKIPTAASLKTTGKPPGDRC